jgi:hypothetical protein
MPVAPYVEERRVIDNDGGGNIAQRPVLKNRWLDR